MKNFNEPTDAIISTARLAHLEFMNGVYNYIKPSKALEKGKWPFKLHIKLLALRSVD